MDTKVETISIEIIGENWGNVWVKADAVKGIKGKKRRIRCDTMRYLEDEWGG